MGDTRTKIVILGGGFGGLYTELELEKRLARDPNVEITLVNRENFISFTPMLHEVAASDLDMTHIVNPLRKMLKRVELFLGEVQQQIDLKAKEVVVAHGSDHHTHALPYDQPTAQHALREGRILARNIEAAVRGGRKRPFVFSTLGQLATIGRRTGVANILGINFSGFIAWWLWRSIYLSKLPRAEKKLRVALNWTLDLLFSKDLVQFDTLRSPTISGPGGPH